MLAFQAQDVPTVDYGNNIRQVALDAGVKNTFDFPGFVPAFIPLHSVKTTPAFTELKAELTEAVRTEVLAAQAAMV